MKIEVFICILAIFCQLTNADTSVCCWMEEIRNIAKEIIGSPDGSILGTLTQSLTGAGIDALGKELGCDKVCDVDNSQWLPRVDANYLYDNKYLFSF